MYSIGVHIYIRLGSGNIGEKWKIHYFELQLNPPFRSLPAIRDHLGSNLPCLGVEYLCPLPGQGNDIETYPKHMETKQMDPYNLQVISIFCCCFFWGGPSHSTFFRNVSEKKRLLSLENFLFFETSQRRIFSPPKKTSWWQPRCPTVPPLKDINRVQEAVPGEKTRLSWTVCRLYFWTPG